MSLAATSAITSASVNRGFGRLSETPHLPPAFPFQWKKPQLSGRSP